MGNLSVLRLYRTKYRDEWNTMRHLVIPVVATGVLLLGLYFSLWPIPAYPNNIALFIVIGWLATGALIAAALWRRHRARFEAAGSVLFESDTTAAGVQDD
jgi:hypothetical protein